jgi:hypothetical protein
MAGADVEVFPMGCGSGGLPRTEDVQSHTQHNKSTTHIGNTPRSASAPGRPLCGPSMSEMLGTVYGVRRIACGRAAGDLRTKRGPRDGRPLRGGGWRVAAARLRVGSRSAQ